jgi:hypothetical protein
MNIAAFCRLAFAAAAAALALSHPLAAMPPDPVVVTNPVTLNPNSPNPVTIGNPDALAKANRAGQRPVTVQIPCFSFEDGSCSLPIARTPPAVPANERWTIEFVSLECGISGASFPDFVSHAQIASNSITNGGIGPSAVDLSRSRVEGPVENQQFTISQPVLFYMSGGSAVSLEIQVSPSQTPVFGTVSGNVGCGGYMSGYAVTTP